MVEELSASHSTDMQQRAYELQVVIDLDAHAVGIIMPSDASCEDIEVIPSYIYFKFIILEHFVQSSFVLFSNFLR